MATEITAAFDGSAIVRNSGLLAAWSLLGFEIDEIQFNTQSKEVALLDAAIASSVPHATPIRGWMISVQALCAAMSAANVERKLVAGWQELCSVFNPGLGETTLTFSRKDTSGNTVSRYLIVETMSIKSYTPMTGVPSPGDWKTAGAYEGGSGHIVFPVYGHTLFPYFIGSSLLTLDSSAATAEINVAAGADTVSITNSSDRWVGCRIRVKTGSVVGSVTSYSLTNALNGDVLKVTNSGGFADGDYVDWFATDPRLKSFNDANSTYAGTVDKMRLDVGVNVLSSARLGGSGSMVLEVLYPEVFLTL